MARLVLLNIFMFLLPFIIYGVYVYITRRSRDPDEMWNDAPLGWLAAAGFGLLFLAIGLIISFSGGQPGQTYHPPVFEDGQIRPGRLE